MAAQGSSGVPCSSGGPHVRHDAAGRLVAPRATAARPAMAWSTMLPRMAGHPACMAQAAWRGGRATARACAARVSTVATISGAGVGHMSHRAATPRITMVQAAAACTRHSPLSFGFCVPPWLSRGASSKSGSRRRGHLTAAASGGGAPAGGPGLEAPPDQLISPADRAFWEEALAPITL